MNRFNKSLMQLPEMLASYSLFETFMKQDNQPEAYLERVRDPSAKRIFVVNSAGEAIFKEMKEVFDLPAGDHLYQPKIYPIETITPNQPQPMEPEPISNVVSMDALRVRRAQEAVKNVIEEQEAAKNVIVEQVAA